MRTIQAKSVQCDPDRKVCSLPSVLCSTNLSKLSLILEYIPGRVTDTLDRLIALYRPDSVVVGTRGKRSMLGGLGMNMSLGSSGAALGIGSVSK